MVRVALHSLGCRTNQVESEALRSSLEDGDEALRFVPWSEVADLYVLNTCTVTARADRQSRQRIHRAHRAAPDAPIVVTGCYAESDARTVAALPGVVAVVGPGRRGEVAELVGAVLGGRSRPGHRLTGGFDGPTGLPGHRVRRYVHRTRAPIKVQEGCDNRCTYCIVPAVRGPSRSLEPTVSVEDARRLAEAGHPEIVVAGTHIGRWGRDLRPVRRLVDLLGALLRGVPGVRFRLSSLDPHEVDDELLQLLRDEPRLCRHLHLTLQHCDPEILGRMGRRAPADGFVEQLSRIRSTVPGIGLGTDVIAGFPGEDRRTFDAMVGTLAEMSPTYLHAFGYSPRPGTRAASFERQVSSEERRERVAILRELSEERLAPAFAADLVGREVQVVLEREGEGGAVLGTSSEFVPVAIRGASPAQVGILARAVVTATSGRGVIGTMVESSEPAGEIRHGVSGSRDGEC